MSNDVADTQLVADQGAQPTYCPVYNRDDRDGVHAPVHRVADEHMASQRVAANCGAMPGELGWVIWYGSVPEHRQCVICLSRPVPRLPDDLTEAQLEGRACIRCGAEDTSKHPVEAWSELSSQLFECLDVEACARRADSDRQQEQ